MLIATSRLVFAQTSGHHSLVKLTQKLTTALKQAGRNIRWYSYSEKQFGDFF